MNNTITTHIMNMIIKIINTITITSTAAIINVLHHAEYALLVSFTHTVLYS